MSRDRFPCGCVADGRQWLAQCPAHRAEHDAYHAAMLADTARHQELEFSTSAAHDGAATFQSKD